MPEVPPSTALLLVLEGDCLGGVIVPIKEFIGFRV